MRASRRRSRRCSARLGSAAACTSCATRSLMSGEADGASSRPFIRAAFALDDADVAKAQWRRVADQLRPKVAKLATLMDDAEADVLAYMTFPAAHRTKLHSTNPLERLNGEIKRRTDVVGIFPRSRYHPARRRNPARAERRVGRAAS